MMLALSICGAFAAVSLLTLLHQVRALRREKRRRL